MNLPKRDAIGLLAGGVFVLTATIPFVYGCGAAKSAPPDANPLERHIPIDGGTPVQRDRIDDYISRATD